MVIQTLSDAPVTIPQGKLPLMARILPENSARLFTRTPAKVLVSGMLTMKGGKRKEPKIYL